MTTQTYWIEPTSEVAVGLRRYSRSSNSGFTCESGYHDNLNYTGRWKARYQDERKVLEHLPKAPHSDPRWPKTCQRCSYVFTEDDEWQEWQELIYRRTDNGSLVVLHDSHPDDIPTAPPGACWNAWWMTYSLGPDGICLMVRLPNGNDWMVDSEASNCTRPGESHQCWVRHGDPRECRVTVDKNSSNTCQAGAGSILSGDYHGFLQNGILTP